ncbi:hypothetical protein VNI00_003203 [Paramarasmius palmivorus]|uniref:Jacalin-type lectin domain-containing protein n=1 Tax=Paramarasmius palmivorus TaxID=297713 RepID=A0AAW0DRR1_9AGAR
MPLGLRSVALSADHSFDDIRVYTKTANGDVREGYNAISLDALDAAKSSNERNVVDMAEGWRPGDLRFECSPNSTLCAVTWGDLSFSRSIFYQTEDGSIRERRCWGTWQITSFVQPDCMMGTSIAVVQSGRPGDMILFFQDSEGYICRRTSHANLPNDDNWEPVVRIQKAAKCTGIAATEWDYCDDVRVYFQDENFTIREYCRIQGFSDWILGDLSVSCTKPVGDIAAISWFGSNGACEIRIYFQNEENDIVEYGRNSDPNLPQWQKGDFKYPALPNSDIVAYARRVTVDHYLIVMWAGPDQIVHQRVDPAGWGWMDPTPIAYLETTGRFMGKCTGTTFSDDGLGSDLKVIKQINVRCSSVIDAISLDFTDGSSTGWHGGTGGSQHSFTLNQGEDIITILVTADNSTISALQFITSQGRSSDWFGSKTGDTFDWQMDGRALLGFIGAAEQHVHGLMPFWSERYSSPALTNVQACVTEADNIKKEVEIAKGSADTLLSQTQALQDDIDKGLKGPADHAMQGISVLSMSIENLYNQTKAAPQPQKDAVDRLVKTCKNQALVVNKRFQSLHSEAVKLRERGSQLSTDLVAQIGTSDSRATRLTKLQGVSDGLKTSAQAKASAARQVIYSSRNRYSRLKIAHSDRKTTAEQSVVNAQHTKSVAESKRDSAKTARILRDIFTLGFGEIDDWGGLNEAIDYANKLIDSCQRNVEAAQNDIQAADNTLTQVQHEIDTFPALQSAINSDKSALESVRTSAIQLEQKNLDLTNNAFDITIYLGGLVARTETVQTKLTASGFAQAILAIEQLLKTPTQVTGLIKDSPGQLENTMEMIAQSDQVADDLGDVI